MKSPFLPGSTFAASTAILPAAFLHGHAYACVVETNGPTVQPIVYIPFQDLHGVATAMAERLADLLTADAKGIVENMKQCAVAMESAGYALDEKDAEIEHLRSLVRKMQVAVAIAFSKLDAIAHRKVGGPSSAADIIAFDAIAAMRHAIDPKIRIAIEDCNDTRRTGDTEAQAA